jgi:hypothetical protein
MKIRRIIKKSMSGGDEKSNVAGGVNAVVAANINEPKSKMSVSTRQRKRIIQRSGKTIMDEESTERRDG